MHHIYSLLLCSSEVVQFRSYAGENYGDRFLEVFHRRAEERFIRTQVHTRQKFGRFQFPTKMYPKIKPSITLIARNIFSTV